MHLFFSVMTVQLKAFKLGVWQFTMVYMHGAKFGTAMQRRYGLAGVQQLVRIEGMLDVMELLQFGIVELYTHLVDFLHANTVLAGDGAANLDTQFQYLATEFFRALQFPGYIGIVKNQWMQVTVAGMENIADRQLVFRG